MVRALEAKFCEEWLKDLGVLAYRKDDRGSTSNISRVATQKNWQIDCLLPQRARPEPIG